jgi:hypothetical protein
MERGDAAADFFTARLYLDATRKSTGGQVANDERKRTSGNSRNITKEDDDRANDRQYARAEASQFRDHGLTESSRKWHTRWVRWIKPSH